MKRTVIAILLIAALAVGWFFVSPLFIDRAVDESFDFLADSGQVDMQAVMAMPPDAQLAMMPEIMDAAANAPDRSAADTMPAGEPRVIATGEFADADAIHKGRGSATLYALGANKHVLRFEDFRTTNGPALVVYLAKHPSPTEASHVKGGGYLSLGKLKGNVGNQNYAIPAEIDVADFSSVVIWCELFDVLFSPAALTRIPDATAPPGL